MKWRELLNDLKTMSAAELDQDIVVAMDGKNGTIITSDVQIGDNPVKCLVVPDDREWKPDVVEIPISEWTRHEKWQTCYVCGKSIAPSQSTHSAVYGKVAHMECDIFTEPKQGA